MEIRPPGLTRQKNAGVRAVHPSTNLIACLDDDIELEDGAMEAMLEFWQGAGADVGGASFNILGRPPATSWAQRIFLMDNRRFGIVASSGYNSPIINAKEDQRSQWLVGGATVWRKNVFREHSFNEWFLGSGLGEDLYFSYGVGKRYKLYVIANATVRHREPNGSLRNSYRSGKVQVINKVYFVRSNPELSSLKCTWTLLGILMGNLARGIAGPDPNRILRALGNAVGLGQVFTGRLPQVEVSRPTARPSAP